MSRSSTILITTDFAKTKWFRSYGGTKYGFQWYVWGRIGNLKFLNSVVTVQTASTAWPPVSTPVATSPRCMKAEHEPYFPLPSPYSLSLPLHSFSFSLAEPDTVTARSHCRCRKSTIATTPSSGSKTYSYSNLAWVTPSLSSPQALTGSPSSVAVRHHGSSSSPVPRPGCCWL